MTRREDLLPPALLDSRPNLAALIYGDLRKLSDEEVARLATKLGAHPPLQELWVQAGCAERYGFAVEAWDLERDSLRTGPTDKPVLADSCFPIVAVARRGRRSLALALAFRADDETVAAPVTAPREVIHQTAGLAHAPGRQNVFLAARFLARIRQRSVRPQDLVDALAVGMTPSLHQALATLGAPLAALDDAAAGLFDEVGRPAVARLREVLIVPREMLALSETWDIREVRTTCGIRLVRDDDFDLPDLDALWLVGRYLWQARIEGIPTSAPSMSGARIPSARAVLRRHARDGWTAVFAGALQASGWEPSIVAADKCTAADLVRRGLEASEPKAPEPPEGGTQHRQERSVERARAEYAELRAALAAKIVRPGIIDRLALVALAHRRGVGQRLLITGQSGAGKSFVARAIAEAVGSSVCIQDVTGLTETGYKGLNVPDLIDAMYKAAGSDKTALESSVLVLDEVEKTRIGHGVEGVSLDKRWGMQACVLGLLQGGTPVVANEGSLVVDTSRMMIVCAGAFSDAAWADVRAPTTADLVEYGIIRELAERLRDRIWLPPRTVEELVEVMRRSDESVEIVVGPLAQELGIHLRVLPSTYVVVARMVAEGRGGMGLRSGNQMLVTAGQRAVLRALEHGGEGIALVTPDDIDLVQRASR